MFQSLQQRTAGKKLAVVEVALDAFLVFTTEGLGGADVEELAGVVPLVDGLVVVLAQSHSQLPEMRNAGGQAPPASAGRYVQRSSASSTARLLRTRARWRLYSSEAAMSDEGLVPSSAELVASATEDRSAPERAFSAAVALKGVEPMLVSPMRAEPIEPFDLSTTAATPTTAQSWARRLNFL